MTKISVIIPVFNVEKYLTECLKSIVNQTFKDIEIICVNDGSTDNSLSILNNFASNNRCIKIINQENKGAGAARNRGMRDATGEYLYFLDSDDFVSTKFLEKMYNKITKTGSDICICKNFNLDMNTSAQKPVFNENPHFFSLKSLKNLYSKDKIFNKYNSSNDLFQLCNIPPYTKLYRHDFIKQNNIKFQEIRTCNDVFFNFYSLACANSIVIINEKLVVHRFGHDSLSKNRAKSIECILLAFSELENALKDKCMFTPLRETFYKRARKCFKYELGQIDDANIYKYWNDKLCQYLSAENENKLNLMRG